MKHIVYAILLSFSYQLATSHETIDRLKSFCEQADMECYYSMIERNVNSYFRQEHQNWKGDSLGMPCKKIEIKYDNGKPFLVTKHVKTTTCDLDVISDTSHIVPMLAIQFVGTDSYEEGYDIYDYIRIDSTIVFTLASVDNRGRTNAFLHFWNSYSGYTEVERHSLLYFKKKYSKKTAAIYSHLPHAIKKIQKQNPELILSSPFRYDYLGDSRAYSKGGEILYIKDNKIYVYDIVKEKGVELNNYIKRNFSLREIRSLNRTDIPYIYTDRKKEKTTGNTPKEEINICD
ncbi:MAG: hypothetical protein J5554_06190 [Paludibacteraceae bacterium]|nr:hypothetical protein [Paludibacteraceae bacterium]